MRPFTTLYFSIKSEKVCTRALFNPPFSGHHARGGSAGRLQCLCRVFPAAILISIQNPRPARLIFALYLALVFVFASSLVIVLFFSVVRGRVELPTSTLSV